MDLVHLDMNTQKAIFREGHTGIDDASTTWNNFPRSYDYLAEHTKAVILTFASFTVILANFQVLDAIDIAGFFIALGHDYSAYAAVAFTFVAFLIVIIILFAMLIFALQLGQQYWWQSPWPSKVAYKFRMAFLNGSSRILREFL